MVSPAKPAKPQLPVSPTVVDVGDRPLEDEGEWWRLAVSGSAVGVEAEGFSVEGCRLERLDLSGGVWTKPTWRDCGFADGNLANVQVTDGGFHRSSFSTMRMTGWSCVNSVVRDVTFTGCRLDLAGFRFSRLRHVVFEDCRLSGVDFTNTGFDSVRFSGCDLTGARLHHATMSDTRLEDCQLSDLSGVAALAGATVASADLLPLTFSLAANLGITVEYGRGD